MLRPWLPQMPVLLLGLLMIREATVPTLLVNSSLSINIPSNDPLDQKHIRSPLTRCLQNNKVAFHLMTQVVMFSMYSIAMFKVIS